MSEAERNSRKKAQKAQKKDYRLGDPGYTHGADTIDLQGTTRPAEIFALAFFAPFVPFCGYSSFAMGRRKLKRAPR